MCYPLLYFLLMMALSFRKFKNRFSEFQNLIYTKNYKSIFDQWNKFKILFINPIFSTFKNFSQWRGFIYLNYKLANKTLKLEYEGSDFSFLIEKENKKTIEDKDNSFFEEVIQFFEDIKDSVNIKTSSFKNILF